MKNAINTFLSITLASLALQACSCNQSDQNDDFDHELEEWEMEWEKGPEAIEVEYKAWEEEVKKERLKMSQEEYKRLLKYYKENYDILSQEEKEEINRKIGKYNGQIVKEEIERTEEAVRKTSERIPSIMEGFFSVFKK